MQGQILSCAKNNSKNTFFYPENTRKTDEKLDQTKIIYKHRRSRGIMIPKKEVLPEEKTSREASQSEREGGMFVGGGFPLRSPMSMHSVAVEYVLLTDISRAQNKGRRTSQMYNYSTTLLQLDFYASGGNHVLPVQIGR